MYQYLLQSHSAHRRCGMCSVLHGARHSLDTARLTALGVRAHEPGGSSADDGQVADGADLP